MDRRYFLKATGLGAASLALGGCVESSQKLSDKDDGRPNILFMFSDDHAAPAISAYKSFLSGVVETPNLDRLANEGMRFDNAFCTNSICTPSRAVVLTGKYSHKNGALTLDVPFDGSQQTFPKLLHKAGYYTAMVGKWHLGTEPTGFDYYNVLPGQGQYFNPGMKESTRPWKRGFRGGKRHEGYVTDIITDVALDTLKNHPKDKPFCLMYQHKAPHDMFEYDKKHAQLYEDIIIPEPFNLFDDYENRGEAIKRCTQKITMEHIAGSKQAEQMLVDGQQAGQNLIMGEEVTLKQMCDFLHGTKSAEFDGIEEENGNLSPEDQKKIAYQCYIKAYLRCVASIDDNVGRVLDYLDEEGLTENTIVIYTSDQGFFLGEHGLFDKRFMYEESLRIPLLIRYPKEIKSGSVNKDIALNVDFAETFLDYAGVPIPKDMQGRSLRPLLEGKTPGHWRQSMYYRYWMHRPHFNVSAHYGVRTHRYKLIFYYGLGLGAPGALDGSLPPEWELFDLAKDPGEMNNVYDDPAYADMVKDLKKELRRLKEQLEDTDEQYPELLRLQKEYW
jgi:arylsulfatase A-like enzyme